MSRLVVILGIATAILVGLLFYRQTLSEPLKISGFIEAHDIRVGSRVGGRVKRVGVEEGDRVEGGQTLIELEPFDLMERQAETAAQLAVRKYQLQLLEKGYQDEEVAQFAARREQLLAHLDKLIAGPRKQEIAAAKSRLELAQAQLTLARSNQGRTETLFGRNVATREDLDQANEQLRVAQAEVQVRTEELELLQEGTRKEELAEARAQVEEATQAWQLRKGGYRQEEIDEARASVTAAEATLAAINDQIAELTIKAPLEGTIEALELRPGDLVSPGAPVLSIMDTSMLWVRAYLPENHLNYQVGDRVKITVDSYPEKAFAGEITFIARNAEFTPSNVQTPEERSKQVFRIKVNLLTGLKELRPGMAADVWLTEPPPPVPDSTKSS